MIQFFMGFTLGAIVGLVLTALLAVAEREEIREDDTERSDI